MSDFTFFNEMAEIPEEAFFFDAPGFEGVPPVDYGYLDQLDLEQLLGLNVNNQVEYSAPVDANNAIVIVESPDTPMSEDELPAQASLPQVRERFVYARDLKGQSYRHSVLGQFPSPTLPLRIIDHLADLTPHVVQALTEGLEQRLEQDALAKQARVPAPEPVAAPEPAPAVPEVPVRPSRVEGKRWIKPNAKTQGKNKRSANIKNFDSTKVYDSLPQAPASWGTPDPLGKLPFRYTKEGELQPEIKLNEQQLVEYLFQHPGHMATGQYNPKYSNLTIWIQNVPADSAKRYPTQHSDKCRYADCPQPKGTIHKGHFRVAFDEQSLEKAGRNLDPFFNAGYLHLYCLEKLVDFAQLCKDLNVKPDDRHFRTETINRMAVTRDHAEMKQIVKDFVKNQPRWSTTNLYCYEQTLCFKLTKEHLRLENKARQATRAKRGGNTIDKHLNNLELFVAGNKWKAGKRSDADENGEPVRRRGTGSKTATGKRKRVEEEDKDEDAEFEIDEEILEKEFEALPLVVRPNKKLRAEEVVSDDESIIETFPW